MFNFAVSGVPWRLSTLMGYVISSHYIKGTSVRSIVWLWKSMFLHTQYPFPFPTCGSRDFKEEPLSSSIISRTWHEESNATPGQPQKISQKMDLETKNDQSFSCGIIAFDLDLIFVAFNQETTWHVGSVQVSYFISFLLRFGTNHMITGSQADTLRLSIR